MKILICEDNPIVAMDLGWMLQDMGHRVCGTASTSIKAMEQTAHRAQAARIGVGGPQPGGRPHGPRPR
jgi:hypothetical protein